MQADIGPAATPDTSRYPRPGSQSFSPSKRAITYPNPFYPVDLPPPIVVRVFKNSAQTGHGCFPSFSSCLLVPVGFSAPLFSPSDNPDPSTLSVLVSDGYLVPRYYPVLASGVMDLDEVDYLDSPLAEGSIWRSTFAASGGLYSESLTASFEDLTQLTDPVLSTSLQLEEPTSWTPFIVPSPTSLGFLLDCFQDSPSCIGPSNLPGIHPPPFNLKPPSKLSLKQLLPLPWLPLFPLAALTRSPPPFRRLSPSPSRPLTLPPSRCFGRNWGPYKP